MKLQQNKYEVRVDILHNHICDKDYDNSSIWKNVFTKDNRQ